jgi:hypothetical protein
MTGAVQLETAVQCAGLRNVDLVVSGGGDINPLGLGTQLSSDLAGIWGVQVTDRTSQNALFGSMVYNALVGNAATVGLNMGGYDYHDGTRTTGNGKDLAAGQVVGKILQTASYLKKKVFIYVCADGATVSAENATADSPWMSDRGIAGMQYLLAHDPAGRPQTSNFHIGGFNSGQAADGNVPTSTSAELAAQAIFANYAAWNGRMDYLLSARILNGDSTMLANAIKLVKS